MPIYEYECGACGAHEEHIETMGEAPKRICGDCGAEALSRLISPASFHLKGGGWYKDGYASSRSIPSGPSSASDAGKPSKTIESGKKKA